MGFPIKDSDAGIDHQLKSVLAEYTETVTPEIRELVDNLSQEQIDNAQMQIDADIESFWRINLVLHPQDDSLDQKSKDSEKYRVFFNNFRLWLPGGHLKQGVIRKEDRKWDIPFGQRLGTKSLSDNERNEHRYSDLRIGQSSNKFVGTIYACIDSSGISLEKIIQIRNHAEGLGVSTNWADFYTFVMPIYTRLFALGYTRKDLTV